MVKQRAHRRRRKTRIKKKKQNTSISESVYKARWGGVYALIIYGKGVVRVTKQFRMLSKQNSEGAEKHRGRIKGQAAAAGRGQGQESAPPLATQHRSSPGRSHFSIHSTHYLLHRVTRLILLSISFEGRTITNEDIQSPAAASHTQSLNTDRKEILPSSAAHNSLG